MADPECDNTLSSADSTPSVIAAEARAVRGGGGEDDAGGEEEEEDERMGDVLDALTAGMNPSMFCSSPSACCACCIICSLSLFSTSL